MRSCLVITFVAIGLVMAASATAQQLAPLGSPPRVTGISPSFGAAGSPPAPLRAVPLPQRSLRGYAPFAGPVRAPYSLPYGPRFSRPAGSPVVPFGSSGYYYHR